MKLKCTYGKTLFTCFLFITVGNVYSQKLSGEYSTNGANMSAHEKDGKLFIGGAFSEVGKHANGFTAVDFLNGKFRREKVFRTNSRVLCMEEDGKGGFYVGGYFTFINDTQTMSLAHLHQDGSIDQLFKFNFRTTNGDGQARFMHKIGDTLLISGWFDTVNGKARKQLCGINLKNRTLMDWSPQTSGAVEAMQHNMDYVFLAGSIVSYNDLKVSNFVTLRRQDMSFVHSIGYDSRLFSLVKDSFRIVAKGNYQNSGWLNTGIEFIDTTDIQKMIHGIQLTGYVTKMEKDPKGGYYAAGEFTIDKWPAIRNLIRLNPDLSLDTTFLFYFNNKVYDMVVSDSFIFCASDNVTVNGKAYDLLAIVNRVTKKLHNYNLKGLAPIRRLYTYKNELIIRSLNELTRYRLPDFKKRDMPYGDLDGIVDSNYMYITSGQGYISMGNTNVTRFKQNGRISRNLAKQYLSECNAVVSDGNGGWFIAGNGIRHVLADGTLDPKMWFDFQMNRAECLLKKGDSLYVGGSFHNIIIMNSNFQTIYLSNFAVINIQTGAIGSFAANINKQTPSYYNNGNIKKMMLIGDTLILSGIINVTGTSNFVSRGNQLKLNIKNFNYGINTNTFDNDIQSQWESDSFIYYGGFFRKVNGIKRPGLCRISKITGQLDAWNPKIDTTTAVHEIAGADSFVYIAARTFAPLKIRNYFWRISTRTGRIVPFGSELDSAFTTVSGFAVWTILVNKDTLYMAGLFNKNIGSKSYINAIKIDRHTGSPLGFHARFGGVVRYMEQLGNGEVLMGGTLYDVEREDNVLLSRFDLDADTLDTWKINRHVGFPQGKVVFDVSKDYVYFAHPDFHNTTIDGVTRNILFRAAKANGAITAFNGKIPYSPGMGVYDVKCFGDKTYLVSNSSQSGYLYKFTGTKDSHQMVQTWQTPERICMGAYNLPFLAGSYKMYNIRSAFESFNAYTGKCEKGMNNYPGTFRTGWSSSVFYSYKDSIFYLLEGSKALGNLGLIYRVNPSINEVVKLDVMGQGFNGFYRKDSSLYIYGNIEYVYSENVTRPAMGIVRFDERKNKVDRRFNCGLNKYVTGVMAVNDALYLTGDFDLVNREKRYNMCAIDIKADTILSFAPDPSNTVRDIISHDTALIILGDFTSTKYGAAAKLAMIDMRLGKVLHNFNAPNSGYTAYDMASDGIHLYVCGNLPNYNGTGISHLVRWNLATKILDTWDPKITGSLNRIAVDDSSVYATGNITKVGNDNQLYYARIRKYDGANIRQNFQLKAPDGGQSYEGSASGLFLTDNLVYLNGDFELDAKRRGVIAINKKNNTPTNYHVDFDVSPEVFYDIIQYDEKLLLSTADIEINNVQSGNIAILDRYQSISYPSIAGATVKGHYTKFNSSPNSIYISSTYNGVEFLVNKSQLGNFLILEKDSNSEGFSSFTPKVSGNKGRVTITLKGAKFGSDDAVYLTMNGDTIWSVETSVIDRNIMIAVFEFQNDSLGNYNLHVKFSSGVIYTHSQKFRLEKTNSCDIRTYIIGYDLVRPDRMYDYELKVENKTNTDVENVPVFLSVTSNGRVQVESMSSYDSFIYTRVDSIGNSRYPGNLYSFILPHMNSQEIFSIPIRIKAPRNDSFVVHTWNQLPLDNQRKFKCLSQVWNVFAGSSVSAVCIAQSIGGMDSLSKLQNEYEFGNPPHVTDCAYFYKSTSVACNGSFSNAALGMLNRFFANPVWVNGVDSVCFSVNEGPHIDSAIILNGAKGKLVVRVVNSIDPNDKTGPRGYSDRNLMTEFPDIFSYVIRFENDSAASAPAQMVIIRDTIDKKFFDISHVTITSFRVGDFRYYFPPGTSAVDRNFDFREKAGIVLHLKTDIDTGKGIITWTFNSLDISTLSVESLNPAYGFLPPNNYTNRGQGAVSFDIGLKPGTPASAIIKNRADIVFDENKSILTPYWEVNRDKVRPSSNVLPLAKTIKNLSFPVSWTGNDASGIKEIEVFISDNNLIYSFWQRSFSDSSVTFTGKRDSTYYFYSVATDVLGNRELIPDSFDASTTVSITSIANISAKGAYTIYPNPGKGIVNIKTERKDALTINVYSLDGRLLSVIEGEGSGISFFINRKGIYILEILSGGERIGTEKLVVE